VIGWIEVESGNVAHLLDEERIGGELEGARAMRLNRESLKESEHGGFGDSAGLCCLAYGPVRSGLWSSIERGRPGRNSSYRPRTRLSKK